MSVQYNLKSPGVKRLMREAEELAEPTEEYYATPLDDNLFEWHFTVRGPPATEFEGGYYHGRILLPSQYPMQPPNIILLTPNGRFETNKKICLSISGYHPESWQPSWSIRTALLALIAFMPTPSARTIGSLEYSKEERQILAKKSVEWECDICGKISSQLAENNPSGVKELTKEESNLINQIALKSEDETLKTQPIEPKENENSDNLRQRVSSTTTDNVSSTDSLLHASIERSNKDKVWFAVIWTIITLITLLVVRRMFFI